MQEWLNWHAWKACVPLKGTAGSNPALRQNAQFQAIGTVFFYVLNSFMFFFLTGFCS